MRKKCEMPSLSWRREIFQSLPRRDVDKQSKSTTRIPMLLPHLNRFAYAEGAHEATALLLLKYLQKNGFVTRFKEQAFALHEIGGPLDHVPDILVELASDLSLHVIQCKAKRFLTEEIQSKFEIEKTFLAERGIEFHVWTEKDKLNRETFETVRAIDRGLRFKPPDETLIAIKELSKEANTMGELVDEFGWDDSVSALAHGKYFINMQEKLHEESQITGHFTGYIYEHLFASRTVSANWWELFAA